MPVVSCLLAALLVFSAVRKLSHAPDVVESYARAGVREEWLSPLAIVLIAAAAGLVVGIFWEPLGIAAAGALVPYFVVACAFHLRNGDAAHLPTPLLMLALAGAVLALS
jgi:DoxX-like family